MSGIIEQFMLMMSQSTGFSLVTGGMVIMWAVCAVLFYLAIVKDLMEINDYPFKKFKLRQVDGNRDFLSPDELKRLEKLKYTDENELNKVRDIFLFSCSILQSLFYHTTISLPADF